MNTFPAFWTALRGVITDAWPELTADPDEAAKHPIFRVTQVQRRPWREYVQQGILVPPWVVVQIPPVQQAPGWGASNVVYRPRVMVYYVTKDAGLDIASDVEAKLNDLETALVAYSGTDFQVMYGFGYDVSEGNAANETFQGKNLPFFGGSLAFDVLIGYIAGG